MHAHSRTEALRGKLCTAQLALPRSHFWRHESVRHPSYTGEGSLRPRQEVGRFRYGKKTGCTSAKSRGPVSLLSKTANPSHRGPLPFFVPNLDQEQCLGPIDRCIVCALQRVRSSSGASPPVKVCPGTQAGAQIPRFKELSVSNYCSEYYGSFYCSCIKWRVYLSCIERDRPCGTPQ